MWSKYGEKDRSQANELTKELRKQIGRREFKRRTRYLKPGTPTFERRLAENLAAGDASQGMFPQPGGANKPRKGALLKAEMEAVNADS